MRVLREILQKTCLAVLASTVFAVALPAAEIRPLPASQVPVLHGSGYTLGTAHGQLFNTELDGLIDTYVRPQFSSRLAWLWALNAARNMEPVMPADLKAEIRGIADASGHTYEEVLVGNSIPELGQMSGIPFGCSTFIVMPARSSSGGMLSGRNLDYGSPQLLSRLVRAFVIATDEKLKILNVGFPGMVGVLTAVNERGVMMSQMYSHHDDQNSRGIPTTMIYRKALEVSTNFNDALTFLRSTTPRATATNTMLSDGTNAAAVEMTATLFATRSPSSSGLIYAANHFETPTMIGTSQPGRDSRWSILSHQEGSRGVLNFENVRATIADAARSMGNVLSVFVDYGRHTLLFGHQGAPTADGVLEEIQLNDVF